MKIKTIMCGIFSSLFLLAAASAAYPCRCQQLSLKRHYQLADTIVTAKIISVETDAQQNTTAKLKVSEIWKKKVPLELEVLTEGSCAYNFVEGDENLLYLQATESGRYATSQCQGNLSLTKARKSTNWLNRYGKIITRNNQSGFIYPLMENNAGNSAYEKPLWPFAELTII